MTVGPGHLVIHDTAPIVHGSDVRETLWRAVDLARLGDRLGYRRYWTAETHGMRAVASCSPAVVCGEVAARTATIRVGAGGVLLPHHPPLLVSEQFGTLEAFHPGRIDLALGRAGGGPSTALAAIRPDRDAAPEAFADQVARLRGWFRNEYQDGVRSVTGYGNEPQLWLLGTHPSSARTAADAGLPYAFGGHLHHAATDAAVRTYRDAGGTHLAVSVGVIAADDAGEAEFLAGSHRLKTAARTLWGERMHLPPPDVAAARPPAGAGERRAFERATEGFVIGDATTVRRRLAELRDRTGADELIVSTPVHDHRARLRSYELVAGAAS